MPDKSQIIKSANFQNTVQNLFSVVNRAQLQVNNLAGKVKGKKKEEKELKALGKEVLSLRTDLQRLLNVTNKFREK